MTEVREFSKAIESWRASLPQELTIPSAIKWDHSNACIIVMHALFYQLNMVFYRTIRIRLSASGWDTIIRERQQLFDATSEASLLFRRAMIHDIIQTMPPFLYVPRSRHGNITRPIEPRLIFSFRIDCVAQLIAIQMEMAQDLNYTAARTRNLEADLHVFIAYFEEVGRKWPYAGVYCKAFKLAQSRAGLTL